MQIGFKSFSERFPISQNFPPSISLNHVSNLQKKKKKCNQSNNQGLLQLMYHYITSLYLGMGHYK